ncbi:unnamed protein product [Sphagnum jensenii]|uniref:Uncharacterized protein n=1 Tax=Sphagnum jensenii TaxID=128206 RepID=A0ABP1AE36_9BRYO
MGVNAKTEVLELISMLKFHIRFLWHIDLKDSEDLASSSKYHLQVLRLSLQQSARRLRCVNSWALLGWDAEQLIVILSHQMKSQCLAISDAYF